MKYTSKKKSTRSTIDDADAATLRRYTRNGDSFNQNLNVDIEMNLGDVADHIS